MEFQRVTPESVGIRSQAVGEMLDELYRYGIEMHSFKLLRHGKVCAEGAWKPYKNHVQHIMFSFSKSLTSTAVGFAWQEGILSLDERLIDIFPEESPAEPSENLKKAAVRHLLMMGCGHETEIPWGAAGNKDWIREFLHHPFVFEPGTRFFYNTAGTNMLSAMITKKTGLTLTEFLKPRLIEPLGLSPIHCQPLPDGTEMGGAGYYITIEDMARFMQFVANKGEWEGRQLLKSEWFDMATAKQIENKITGNEDPDWQQGYCFQFWRCEPEGVFRGDGAFGQYGIVMTKQDAVLVIHSASLKLQSVLTAVWDKLLPGITDSPLPEDPESCGILKRRLESLELNAMLGMRNPGGEYSLNGAVYVPDGDTPAMTDIIGGIGHFIPHGGRMKSLGFRFDENALTLICKQEGGVAEDYEIKIGMNGHYAETTIGGETYGGNGCWTAKDKITAEIRNVSMVSGKRFVFKFGAATLTMSADSTIPEVGGLADPLTPDYTFTLPEGEISTRTKMYWEQK